MKECSVSIRGESYNDNPSYNSPPEPRVSLQCAAPQSGCCFLLPCCCPPGLPSREMALSGTAVVSLSLSLSLSLCLCLFCSQD